MLAIVSTALVTFAVFLFLSVNREQEVEVPQTELAKARIAYERRQPEPAPARPDTGRLGGVAHPAARPAKPPPDRRAEPETGAAEDVSELTAAFGEPAAFPEGADFRAKRKYVRRIYDRKRYPSALELAVKLLEERPRDIFLLRVAVSAACFIGEPDVARAHWQRIRLRGKRARRKLVDRCAEYGVELPDDPDAAAE